MDKLNGLLGCFILIIVLLSVVCGLGFQAWKTQKAQATQAYSLDVNEIKANDSQNKQFYILK